jgi:hypothetical protein
LQSPYLILFLISFVLHFYGSIKNENEELALKGLLLKLFVNIFSVAVSGLNRFRIGRVSFYQCLLFVVLSVLSQQKSSPQSKPVDAPNYETGE